MTEAVDELIARLPDQVRAATVALRRLVRSNVTDAFETVYHNSIAYAPAASRGDMILFIAPQNGYVRLGFFFGSELSDPAGLLEGEGKRMRHLKVRSEQADQEPAIAELVRSAWQEGPRSYAEARSK